MIRIRVLLILMVITFGSLWLRAVESSEPEQTLRTQRAEEAELGFPQQGKDGLEMSSKNILLPKTLLARCLLAAKGIGGGFAFLCCGPCIAGVLKNFPRIHSERSLSIKNSELLKDSSSSNKMLSSVMAVGVTVLFASIALKAGEYSLGNFKEVFGGK